MKRTEAEIMANVFSVAPDRSAEALVPVPCRSESRELQELLERNPDLLPGSQIEPDDPRRWLLVRRELPIPSPATGENCWSIDHVFADQHAIPTLVECKRFADPRSRREVVGQMLEYAANGQYYWDAERLMAYAAEAAEAAGRTLDELLAGLDGTSASSPEEFFAAFVQNLREGRVRLVFFLEEAPVELKSIVEFLNGQMERAEVLIVEARQYELDGKRIVVPSLFGFTEDARRAKRRTDSSRPHRTWDCESFLDHARTRMEAENFRAVERILTFVREQGFDIKWGSGQDRGSFSVVVPDLCRRSIFSVYSDGRLTWNFGSLRENALQQSFRDALADRLRQELNLEVPGDLEKRYPSMSLGQWAGSVSALEDLLVSVIEKWRKSLPVLPEAAE